MPESPLIPEQRQRLLLEALRSQGPLSIRALAERLNVSHMTVRRDVVALSERGAVVQIRGGVRLSEDEGGAVPLELSGRVELELPRKEAIASAAVRKIEDDMCVYLDAGTTMHALASSICRRQMKLTVVTNDMLVAKQLLSSSGVHVVIAGGGVDATIGATEGHVAALVAGMYNYDVAFLSSPAWSLDRGMTSPSEGKRQVKRAVMDVSASSILLADSSKYGSTSAMTVCALGDLDEVITDDGLRGGVRDRAQNAGIQITTASVRE